MGMCGLPTGRRLSDTSLPTRDQASTSPRAPFKREVEAGLGTILPPVDSIRRTKELVSALAVHRDAHHCLTCARGYWAPSSMNALVRLPSTML